MTKDNIENFGREVELLKEKRTFQNLENFNVDF